MTAKKHTRGMVLGKFMPPHRGHQYLVDTASNYVDELCVVVGSLESEPISGELRVSWMRELYGRARVVHHTANNPQLPEESTDFWTIWRRSLEDVLPWPVDFLFAGEPYGARLAQELGAKFVPVSRTEVCIKVSGTSVRADPFAQWDNIPDCVRAHYAKRVAIIGPESCGKSTLAATLAQHFNTVWVPEHARAVLETDPLAVQSPERLVQIAHGQRATEQALARRCNRLLFCDTDALTTKVWNRSLFADQSPAPELDQWAHEDSYALTLLCAPDVPWVADPVRYFPHGGTVFFDRFEQELALAQRPYVVLKGSWNQRLQAAVDAVSHLTG